jgi:hypothetical protein
MADFSEYENKILVKSGSYEASYQMSEDGRHLEAGCCEFCGHPIGIGYEIKEVKTGKIMVVGCDCYGNLLRLDATKKRILKHNESLIKNKVKYANVLKFLETYQIPSEMIEVSRLREVIESIKYKILNTTRVNSYWFEEFERITKIDLKKVN